MEKKHRPLLLMIAMTLAASGILSWHLLSEGVVAPRQGTADILAQFSDEPSRVSTLVSDAKLIPLGTREAISLGVRKDGREAIYYERTTGKVFSVGFEGKNEKIVSETPLSNLIKSIWSPTMKEVFSFFHTKSGVLISHYNYTTRKATPLPSDVDLPVFSPDGNQFAYIKRGKDGFGVYVGTLTANKKILNTRSVISDVRWPSADTLALTIQSNDGTAALFTLQLSGELTRITDFLTNLKTRWASDGKHVLISFTGTDNVPRLIAHNIASGVGEAIEPSASAHRCAWSIDTTTIFCARDGERGQVLEKIDIASGKAETLLGETSRSWAIEEILLSPLEDYLLIINAFDHRPYSITL